MSLFTKVKNIFRKKVDADSNFCAQHYDKNNFYVLTEFEREAFPGPEYHERNEETNGIYNFIDQAFPKFKNYESLLNDARHIPFAVIKGTLGTIYDMAVVPETLNDKENHCLVSSETIAAMHQQLIIAYKGLDTIGILIYNENKEDDGLCQFDSVRFEDTIYFDSKFEDKVSFAKNYIEEQCKVRSSMELDVNGMQMNPLAFLVFTFNRLFNLYAYLIQRTDEPVKVSCFEYRYMLHHLWRSIYMVYLLENHVYKK